MSKQIVVHNIDELDKYKNTILDNLNNSVNMLQQVFADSCQYLWNGDFICMPDDWMDQVRGSERDREIFN